jgi:hypothetical protein
MKGILSLRRRVLAFFRKLCRRKVDVPADEAQATGVVALKDQEGAYGAAALLPAIAEVSPVAEQTRLSVPDGLPSDSLGMGLSVSHSRTPSVRSIEEREGSIIAQELLWMETEPPQATTLERDPACSPGEDRQNQLRTITPRPFDLLRMLNMEIMDTTTLSSLEIRDLRVLCATAKPLERIVEQHVLRLLKNSSVRIYTMRCDRTPPKPLSELLRPVPLWADRPRELPHHRVIFEPDYKTQKDRYSLRKIAPLRIEFFYVDKQDRVKKYIWNLKHGEMEWRRVRIDKSRTDRRRREFEPQNKYEDLQRRNRFFRFTDHVTDSDGYVFSSTFQSTPVHVVYRKNPNDDGFVRLHFVSFPVRFILDRLSRPP